MAGKRQSGATVSSGRRRYLLYQYGNHFWVPETVANFSKGMIRDTAREAIPAGAVYDSADYLLHQPGIAQKRGGTSYAGPALTGAAYTTTVASVPFFSPGTTQLLAVGSNSHLYKITAGLTTDIGALSGTAYEPLVISPAAVYALILGNGGFNSQKYDGTTISAYAGGGLDHAISYKSRIAGASSNNPQRLFFSQTPDVDATWDMTNSWIDFDYGITGLAALNTALLVFSSGHIERVVGATPPPSSDMDRAPLAPIGCTDSRSITQTGSYVYFANPEGVYFTNGSTPISLTEQGGIATYWRSLFSGYLPATLAPSVTSWTIATGFFRGFLFVSVLNASRTLQAALMCNVAQRAWWRLTNIKAMGFTTSSDGNEFYYANADTNRVTALSGIFSPTSANKNDADGTAVTPTIEFAPIGQGPGVKAYGFGHLDFDMRDAASDNPTMAVTVKSGIEADTSTTPVESPLVETLTLDRPRFSVCRDAQAVTISLSQTNASSKTELYALEVEQRPQSLVGDGIT